MGLLSSLNKVVGYTNSIIGVATTPWSTHTNVSSNEFLKVIGMNDSLSFNSISDIKNSITSIKSGIAQGVNMANCAYHLITNPGEILDMLDQLATGVMGAIGSVIDQIFDALAVQISMAAQQIVGTIVNLVSALYNLWNAIQLITQAVISTVKSWADWSDFKIEFDLQTENCKDMFAAIGGCFLNKFLGNYLEEFANKVTGKINEIGNDFNNILYDELQDTNTFAQYANHEAFLLKKASIQMKGLSKQNLLG